MVQQEAKDYIAERITRKDCLAWHSECRITRHLARLMKEAGVSVIQVWGVADPQGMEEPVSIVIEEMAA